MTPQAREGLLLVDDIWAWQHDLPLTNPPPPPPPQQQGTQLAAVETAPPPPVRPELRLDWRHKLAQPVAALPGRGGGAAGPPAAVGRRRWRWRRRQPGASFSADPP